MARKFNGTDRKLVNANPAVTGVPLTLAAWFNSSSAADNQAIVGICDILGNTNNFLLRAGGAVAGDPVQAIAQATAASGIAASTTGYTTNQWTHACAVFRSATSRDAYIDGGSKGSETTSATPAGLDRTSIGVRESLAPAAFFNGDLQEAAIWNVDLTDAEVALLATGVQPTMVRAESLVAYWPIFGDDSPEPDEIGTFDLTVTNAIKSTHRWMLAPGSPLWIPQPAQKTYVRL